MTNASARNALLEINYMFLFAENTYLIRPWDDRRSIVLVQIYHFWRLSSRKEILKITY